MSSWARLLAIGSKEPSAALRKIDLTAPSASIGRKEGCTEKISDNTVSSVHCRIKLVQDGGSAFNEDGGSALTVWLEDTSANGTYVNSQKVGKGNHVRLRPNDEIGLIRPCGGAERPPWAFIFQDFTDELSAGQIRAVFRGGSEPEVEPPSAAPPSVGATPLATPRVIEAASPAVKFEPALPSSSSPALIGSPPAVLPLGGARSSTRGVPAAPPAEDVNPLMSSMRILAAPDPAGLRELRGTLRRGQMDIGDFVSADGPSALLDVISEVVAKPKLGWIDLEVLDGALGALKELMNAPDGANSVLQMEGALGSLASLLTLGETRVLSKAVHILTCLVVCSEEPLVEAAVRKVARTPRAGGTGGLGGVPSLGALLVGLLHKEIDSGTACQVLTLMNTLIACSPSSDDLVGEISASNLDDGLATLEPLIGELSEELRMQVDILTNKIKGIEPGSAADDPSGAGGEGGPQLRQLHWQKIPPARVDGSVWASLPPAMLIDETELRSLFIVKEKALASAVRKIVRADKEKKKMLLDLKRSNQIQIALAKFKKTPKELRDCVLTLDELVIKAEDTQKLRSCAPTPEEMELLAPYQPGGEAHEQAASLENADMFLLMLSQIPRLIPRLECFHTKLTMPMRLSDAKTHVSALAAAVEAVRASSVLPQLLALILAVGNLLNAGTLKAGAKGFRLEVLTKLPETKSSGVEPPTTLLHHLAAVATRHAPELPKLLKGELKRVEEASTITLSNVETEIGVLRRELEVIGREVPLVGVASEVDRFHGVMRAFSTEGAGQLEALEKAAGGMRTSLLELSRYLGDDGADAQAEPEIVLHRIHAFVTSFGKACRDNERAALLKKKQEEAAEAKARTDADAKAAATDGAGSPRGPETPHVRKVMSATPGGMMSNIQGSLRRGEFHMMKQMQAQMSEELASRLRGRRRSMVEDTL